MTWREWLAAGRQASKQGPRGEKARIADSQKGYVRRLRGLGLSGQSQVGSSWIDDETGKRILPQWEDLPRFIGVPKLRYIGTW